jgi:hypothetical protein
MRDRRPVRFERDRPCSSRRRAATRPHRRDAETPDLVEEVLGDLGWRRIDLAARRLRRSLRTVFLATAVVAIGSFAFETVDRLASVHEANGLDEAIRRFGEVPASWRQSGWTDWMGGIDLGSSESPKSERQEGWSGVVAAAPWSPV